MIKAISRLSRFEEKRMYRKIVFSIVSSLLIFGALFFLGLPALIKFSLFIDTLRNNEPTQQETTPLFPPRLETLYTATNSATITIKGFSQSQGTLEVFLNGETSKKIVIPGNGQFTLPDLSLKEGENIISALSKDENGNASKLSNVLTIIYKKTAPSLVIDQPQEGQSFNADQKEVKIIGKTETETSVTVNNRLVMADKDGNFTYSLPLNQGENVLKIIATDLAGNQTTVERKVTYTP